MPTIPLLQSSPPAITIPTWWFCYLALPNSCSLTSDKTPYGVTFSLSSQITYQQGEQHLEGNTAECWGFNLTYW